MLSKLGLAIAVFLLFLGNVRSANKPKQCGYQSCDLGNPKMLNVHLIPHTHDDVGWLKTINEYYWGAKNSIQNAGVQYILDSTIQALLKDKNRRFIYVEMAFFYRWWIQQDSATKDEVRMLVSSNRLQFILGGWSMADEATTHYTALIDEHTRGLRFIRENFGECGIPQVAWQIDPFGHSKEMASLLAQMGYDSVFFQRIDYREKEQRNRNRTMEMIWEGSSDLGEAADLFTSVLYQGYCQPVGFCFDQFCADPPVQDDPRIYPTNVKDVVTRFINYVKNEARNFTSNHIMVPMGCDFQFQNAHHNYKNLDKFIYYINSMQTTGSNVNVLYSTPSCYTYAVNQANLKYTTKTDDFFPYASDKQSYWTGFYTSRAALKDYVRKSNNFLQSCEQAAVLAGLSQDSSTDDQIDVLRRAMAVLQHHDAVSGTEKQAVAYDYAFQLANGLANCEDVLNTAYRKLSANPNVKFEFCHMLNISACHATESLNKVQNSVDILAYNPVAQPRSHWIRVPVTLNGGNYVVTDLNTSKVIPSQIIPISNRTILIPERKDFKGDHELVFQLNLPALGYNTARISIANKSATGVAKYTGFKKSNEFLETVDTIVVKNKLTSLVFNKTSGFMISMQDTATGYSIKLTPSFQYYNSMANDSTRDSGAYIFRPETQDSFKFDNLLQTRFVQGDQVQEIHQEFSDWLTLVIRLYRDQAEPELHWTVGPIPVEKNNPGKEVILNYATDIDNFGFYYTDANGRQIMMRQRDHRLSYNFTQTEPVAGNYYPINSRAMLMDTIASNSGHYRQLTIFTDRSEGGGSIHSGEMEIMLHRRTTKDDGFGVGEPLNETGTDGKGLIVRGKHVLMLSSVENSAKLHRPVGVKLFAQPILAFSGKIENFREYHSSFRPLVNGRPSWSALNTSVSESIHLLTLDLWENGTTLVRFEHIYESTEDPDGASKPQTIDLRKFFVGMKPVGITELSLAANQKLSEMTRLKWNKSQTLKIRKIRKENPNENLNDFTITLHPMQIRTFMVTFSNQ